MARLTQDLDTLSLDTYIVTGGNASASLTATGISTDDKLICAIEVAVTTGYMTDRTANTSIYATNAIRCTDATNNDTLIVWTHDADGARPIASPNLVLSCALGVNATTFTLTGIKTEDTILSVIGFHETTGVPTDRTANCTISATDTITQTGNLSTEGLLILWHDASSSTTRRTYSHFRPMTDVVGGEAANTNMDVTGITTSDALIGVLTWSTTGVLADDLAQCSITSAGHIQSTTDNSAANLSMFVLWNDATL